MCGLFGMIGNIDAATMRALAIANRDRGMDSLGFFNSTGQHWKRAKDPYFALPEASTFLSARKPWFCVGHTRAATQGGVTKPNAHPFRYGDYLGAHNGIVHAPKQYAVDSQYLIDRLRETKGDYQSALAGITGYWSLAWFDGRSLHLACHDNKLAILVTRSAVIFSSDEKHLLAASPPGDLYALQDGGVIRFDRKLAGLRKWAELPDFVSTVESWSSRWYGCDDEHSSYKWEQDPKTKRWERVESYGFLHHENPRTETSRTQWYSTEELVKRCGYESIDDAMFITGAKTKPMLRRLLEDELETMERIAG